VGCLSGHWHTSRVVRDPGGAWHVNTGNATFGGYDWAPAHGRLVRWDGTALSLETVTRGGSPGVSGATSRATAGPVAARGRDRWGVRLPGAAHLGRPVAAGDAVLMPWLDDDRASGGVVALDADSGERRWTLDVGTPVRGGVALAGDAVVVAGVDGRVVCADLVGGAERWRAAVGDDPLLNWVYATPVVAGDAVVSGEWRNLACLALADGSVRWRQGWWDPFQNTHSPSGGVVAGGTLVMGLAMATPHTVGLEVSTGEQRWSVPEPEYRCPLTELVVDPDDGAVIVGRMGGRIDKLVPETGELVWKTRVGTMFLTGRPLRTGELLVVTTGAGHVARLDPRTGQVLWSTGLDGEALLAFGPYRRSGQALTAGAVLGADGFLWVGATDGWVWRLDPERGTPLRWRDVGVPLTAPLVPLPGGDLIVAAADGSVRRILTEPEAA
jgi:outer membrane protein assembly factor BamB